jgi:putative tryptophan/tyrosine transport system substrate-binding protein
MNRRELLFFLGSAMTAARTLRAQQKAMPVIGFLNGTSQGAAAPFVAAFHQGLSGTGYVEGQNVAIEHRWAQYRYDRLPALAADLVSRKVDLIAACGGAGEAPAAKDATSTIPIVFTYGGDPVERGLVVSLARPGGNLTGVTIINVELMPKRLELISELVPQAKVIALLVNPNSQGAARIVREVQEGARTKGLQLHVLKASTESEIDTAFATLVQLRADALLPADPLFDSRREQIVGLAARHAVPAIYIRRDYVTVGGLISYGSNIPASYRQAGIYAGRILKGAKPADLPVEQPTTFELVVNLKTAKALGLTVPPSILARADEVIE